MASTYLTRTLGSSSNSGTISMWVKRGKLGATQYIYANLVSGTNYGIIFFDSNDRIEFMTVTSGSHTQKLLTTRKFIDTNAWYHFVFATDTDNSTATNRLRLYVNGVEETAFDTDATGSQGDTNYLFQASATNDHVISGSASQSDLFDGSMAHVHIVPGSQLAPTIFGETDSTSGVWKPKVSPSVTYTAQGSFLKFENSAAMGTDSSGNSNTWTVGGTLTQNVDTPNNNFATFNPLEAPEPGEMPTYSYGNLQGASTNAGHINGISSLAVETGKFYAEFKCTGRSGATDDFIGVIASPAGDLGSTNINDAQSNNKTYGIRGDGSKYEAGSGSSFAGSYAINDIIGVALDVTNSRLYFSKNGQWQNGTSWNSASPNSYITIPSGNTWHFLCGDTANSQSYTWQGNFGQGYFGITAVASANADANGHGKMEYAVPSGYYTLNTKNIKEFG
jgi:hypothetical protein